MISPLASPTHFSPAHSAGCESFFLYCDEYAVSITNVGERETDGSPVTVTDELPPGVTLASLRPGENPVELEGAHCTDTPVQCVFPETVNVGQRLEMHVRVMVEPGASSGPITNRVSVAGGGAPEARSEETNEISSVPARLGFSQFDFHPVGVNGLIDSQAGDHPNELDVTLGLDNVVRTVPDGGRNKTSVEDVKDIVVDLPLGFVASTLAAPQCTLAQLSSAEKCPQDTTVGHLETKPATLGQILSPIWNLVPDRGYPAEFGYRDVLGGAHVLYAHVIPTPAGYVLETVSPDISQISLDHIFARFYGNPAARDQSGGVEVPYFTNPTICSAASMTATAYVDSWLHPGRFFPDGSPDYSDPAWVSKTSVLPPPSGCNLLAFGPELKAQPTTNQADTPSGLDFELKLAQSEQAGTVGTPPLRDSSVTFPAGFTINPSAASGLQACSEAQVGWKGPSLLQFSREAQSCPEASKIGSLEVESPITTGVLHGAMYLAEQDENPFHSVLGFYVVVEDPVKGIVIKIAGRATADKETGQITGTFLENPQLPFSDLKLHFFGGPRAVFATPESCGTFTTTSILEPWSAPDSGPNATPFDSFLVDTGCVSGFNPQFTGGSTNLQAGAYSPFVVSFTRSDTDQDMGGLSVSLPPGLLAKLTGVPLCPDAQAAAGTCSEASQVGTVKAGAGPGPNSLFVTGKVYLTGPYKGAPYGLSVVVPAIAGPFNFGNVVVRQALFIDPNDAHVTAVSDPFPRILRPTGADGQTVGIPIRLRRIDVSIDRLGFTFNPTNCSKLQVSGSISSIRGESSALTTPFQVTNCQSLKFAPQFSVSTSGKTSRASGASLTAKLSYPNAPQGTYANIARVKVELPSQLPSRLTTLQKACTAAQFQANPAGCPSASIIGHATVITPLLPLPLSGPAYFVSHGGEAFPSLTLVLQGSGVTVDLVGTTFINRAGVTSTTFKTVPDTPFSTFELTLPQGPFSALVTNLPAKAHGSFCGQKLIMPTLFEAQNGLEIHQDTPVAVTGCTKAKKTHRARHQRRKASHNTKRGRR